VVGQKTAALLTAGFILLSFTTNAKANYLTFVVKKTQEEIAKFNKFFGTKKQNSIINGIIQNQTNKTNTKTNAILKTNKTSKNTALVHSDPIKQFFNQKQFIIDNIKSINFTNTTAVNPLDLPTLTNNINLLYKMGYLPFYAKKVDSDTGLVTWQWDAKTIPSELVMLTPKSLQNILYKSAVKHFLRDIGLNRNTELSISSLLKSSYKAHWQSSKPFTWVLVNQKLPERLKVWQNGSWIIESNCNTGVNHLTPDGNFMVYARYKYFTMSGVFPVNDQPYYDPDVPYVNFFDGGDAIHGFPRYSYGYPQSAGCVELPVKTAKKIFHYLYVGTVVTIVN
jgi:hypothetical protein